MEATFCVSSNRVLIALKTVTVTLKPVSGENGVKRRVYRHTPPTHDDDARFYDRRKATFAPAGIARPGKSLEAHTACTTGKTLP